MKIFLAVVVGATLGVVFSLLYTEEKREQYRELAIKQNALINEYEEFSDSLLALSREQQETMDKLVLMIPTE